MEDLEPTEMNQMSSSSFFERWKRHFFMSWLIMFNLLNYMDRYVVAGKLADIKESFNINFSLGGSIFSVFLFCYMLAAPLFGYYGDRYNRKYLISLGLLIWIVSVLISSICENFILFLIFRACAGIGEAAYATITPTLISDLFNGLTRSRCLMFFYIAMPIGSGLGYIIGPFASNALGSWRWGLRFPPVIGLLLLIIMFFFDEPVRGSEEHEEMQQMSFWEDLKSLCKNRTYVYVTLASSAITFVIGSLSWWTPAYVAYAWAYMNGASKIPPHVEQSIGFTFGVLTCSGGLIGVFLGAMIAHWWKHGVHSLPIFKSYSIPARGPRADAEICGFATLVAVPMLWAGLFTIGRSVLIGWVFIFLTVILMMSNMSVTTDMVMHVTPPIRRATAVAMQTLCVHLLGDAVSSYIVGVLSDTFNGWNVAATPSEHFESLQYALFLPNAVLLLAAFFYFLAGNHIEYNIVD